MLWVCYFTHRGFVRENNEDALLIGSLVLQQELMEELECIRLEDGSYVFAVADGLGGHRGGEVASRMVLEVLAELKPKDEGSLLRALKEARDKLEKFAREYPAYLGLGTAVAGMVTLEEKAIVFNVGDCRVYKIEEGKAQRLTQDHTEAEELIRAGLLTPQRAKHDPRRNFLTSAIIGSPEFRDFEVFMKRIDFKGDYLVCSDGLWEALEDEELALPPDRLVELSLSKGGSDNVTLLHIRK